MTKEELARLMYDANPLWDHAFINGDYRPKPIAWDSLADHGHEADAKQRCLSDAEVALRALS